MFAGLPKGYIPIDGILVGEGAEVAFSATSVLLGSEGSYIGELQFETGYFIRF